MIVLTLAIWFQGAWALLLWRRPDRDLLAVGLFANAALFAGTFVAMAAGSNQGSPSAPQLLAMAGQAGLIVCCLSMLVGRPTRAPYRTLPIALATGLVAVGLAAVSLTVSGTPSAARYLGTDRGQQDGHRRRASRAPPLDRRRRSPSLVAGLALTAPSPSPSPPPLDSPSPAGAALSSAAAASVTPQPPASATTDPTADATPTIAATHAVAASPALTPDPGSTATATATRTPSASATNRATTAPATGPPVTSTPGSTPRPTPRPTSTPRPTPRPTPNPTPRPTPNPTPSPTPTQTPEPSVARGDAGTITFGRDYDPTTLALIGPTRTLRVGQQVAWRADLTEPAGTTTLTFTVTEPLPSGKEFPHWQQDFSVADPSFAVLAKRVDMSAYVHDEPGNYIMRIRRGADGHDPGRRDVHGPALRQRTTRRAEARRVVDSRGPTIS